MELTGKAKEDFNNWYLNHIKSYNDKLISNTDTNYFNLLTDSMKYGVYVDWFDSVGIFIQTTFYDFDSCNWQIFIECENQEHDYEETHLTSRQEARLKAIEKANEIYNNG